MSLYHQAGEHCCGGVIFESDRHLYADSMAKARSFIWQHWYEKRRGYITVNFYNGHGEVEAAHFFIEPNNQGEWRIRCRILREDSYGDDLDWQSVKWRIAKKYHAAQRGARVLGFTNEKEEEDFAF